MGQQLTIPEIRGLTPLIDPKRLADPVIVDGTNFYVPSDGPTSGFARREVLHRAFVSPRGIQSLRINALDSIFYFTNNAVLEYDSDNRQLIPQQAFPATTFFWPWTRAVVGGNIYFARKGVGLIRYVVATGKWEKLTGLPSVPNNIVAITQSGGRLCALADGVFAWSAIDNGTDFAASTVTGAGAQSLALVNAAGANQALMILPYEFGVLCYTTEGIMRSELIESINPFRHRAISNQHVPINPYCVLRISHNEQVLLTRSGFYITTGQKPEIWQPVMSEHFHLNVLPQLDLGREAVMRLSYNFDRGWFMVSYSDGTDTAVYNKCFMLYLPSDQWGFFNRVHTAFVEVKTESGPKAGFSFGFCDNQGSLFKFTDDVLDELFPDDNFWAYDYKVPVEWPARIDCLESDVNRMPTVLNMPPISEHIFKQGAGVYDLDSDITSVRYLSATPATLAAPSIWDSGLSTWDDGTTTWDFQITSMSMITALRHLLVETSLALPKLAPLDSFVRVGVFRAGKNVDVDELINVQTLSISANEPPAPQIKEDYINDYLGVTVLEDWTALAGPDEDYGVGYLVHSNYSVELRGTIDGFDVWQGQQKVPVLIQQEGRTRFFDARSVTGLYHLIDIKAFELNEAFQLKLLDLEILPVGRLT